MRGGECEILLFEDSETDVVFLRHLLEKLPASAPTQFKVTAVPSLQRGIDLLRSRRFDLMLLDLNLKDSSGLETLSKVKHEAPELTVVVLTGSQDEEMGLKALQAGAQDFLSKGNVDRAALVRSLRYAMERKQAEESLWRERSFSEIAINSLPGVFYVVDSDGDLLRWNKNLEIVSGRDGANLKSLPLTQLIAPEEREEFSRALQNTSEESPSSFEGTLLSSHGGRTLFLFQGRRTRLDRECIVGMGLDISARKHAEESLALLAAIVESSGDAIVGEDSRGRIVSWNRAAEQMFGFPAAELLGQSADILIPLVGRAAKQDFAPVEKRGDAIEQYETVRMHRDGRLLEVALTVSPIRSARGERLGFSTIYHDIADRKKSDLTIQRSLREKEVLLREIHHRVKNNLQIISSLLELQSDYIRDPDALRLFGESQDRIRTMALIHEKLYRSEDVGRVDFADYLQSLVALLMRAQAGKGRKITVDMDVDPASFSIDTAIAVGLITNELVSNSLKHAFVNKSMGNVRVALKTMPGGQYQLSVADDGPGLPSDVAKLEEKSLGLRLVKILVGQIEGTWSLQNAGGARCEVYFRAA
jgi:PAS domain S-box-containing protein